MPAKVKVRILAGRNLPVMDKSSDASDAFAEVKLANTTFKTEVYRRSLNPFWNSEWFRFEVSDAELQDEPLQIRVMDYDTYSANDAIGKVYINLNPFLINPSKSMSGWLPIYDTMHGIRGEINCIIKVNFFSDSNRYRQSSCGVQFFFSDIPNGYRCEALLGFVEELLVSDDPEYQWIDKIRTPRASNEARQTLLTKLSGEVQRKLGLKAEIFGGNAVIGYQQSFNLEGNSGIVGRGIGTAIILSKINDKVHDETEVQPSINSHHKQSILSRPLTQTYLEGKSNILSGKKYEHGSISEETNEQTKLSSDSRKANEIASDRLSSEQASASRAQASSPTLGANEQSTIEAKSSKFVNNQQTSESSSGKRWRPKSQSASTDDHLSTIEEKIDDDSAVAANASKNSFKENELKDLKAKNEEKNSLKSSTTTKSLDVVERQRSVSVDADGSIVKSVSEVSSTSMEEEDEPGYSSIKSKSSSSTAEDLTQIDETSLFSSSTPRESALNEPQSAFQNSLSKVGSDAKNISSNKINLLRRSDTDLMARKANLSEEKSKKGAKTVVKHASLTKDTHIDDSSFSTASKPATLRAQQTIDQFASSVKLIKSQQHLLQTLIKNQNQILMTNSYEKARNMFIFPNRIHQAEYPFVTLHKYPDGLVKNIGGVVSVHSVKLLDNVINDDESETRDAWWIELRKEIRSHAKALNCNTILGYREYSQVLVDVCILSACGTAAVIESEINQESYQNEAFVQQSNHQRNGSSTTNVVNNLAVPSSPSPRPQSKQFQEGAVLNQQTTNLIDCSLCHTPLECTQSNVNYTNCCLCLSKSVPDILLMTIEPPNNLNIASRGVLVQARVCRAKRDSHGEVSAKEISDALLFLEYELHRQLVSKLKFKGLNCLFSLTIDISVGENMISGVATGTGCFVLGLPIPSPPKIMGKGIKPAKLSEVQSLLETSAIKNRESLKIDEIISRLVCYHRQMDCSVVDQMSNQKQHSPRGTSAAGASTSNAQSTSNSNNLMITQDFMRLFQRENNMVLEVDDSEDAEIIALLIDNDIPNGYSLCNSETLLDVDQDKICSMNMFTQVMRSKLSGLDQFQQQFDWIIQSLLVKLRRSLPCCLTNLNFVVDLPESNIVQITVTGCVVGMLSENALPNQCRSSLQNNVKAVDSSDSPSLSLSSSAISNSSASTTTNNSAGLSSSNSSLSSAQQSSTTEKENMKVSAQTSTAVEDSVISKPSILKKRKFIFKTTGRSISSANKTNQDKISNTNLLEETTRRITSLKNLIQTKSASNTINQETACKSGTKIPEQSSKNVTTISRKQDPNEQPEVSKPDITSLSYIPGYDNYQYLGNLSFSFVRESSSVRENGGLNGFIHSFLMEVYAIVRAHVFALGGNAFLSFRIQQSCIFYHSNKNQAQCLMSVAGDAALVAMSKPL